MATKLDQLIANVTLEVASGDPAKMITAATEAAPKVSPEEAATLPERWYPKITAKAAGAPQLRDAWPRAWFEAIVEILCQKGSAGLPALFELLERDKASYHEMVVLRLLRMAAGGLERDAILAKIKARLPELHQTEVAASVREVVAWSDREPQPLELLRPMAKLKVKNAEGATVGTYIKQSEADLASARARSKPQRAADPVNDAIVSVAVLGHEADRFQKQAVLVARNLGPSETGKLAERLKKPDLPILQTRLPPTLSNHEAIWCRSIMEILEYCGAEAIPLARSFLDDDDAYVRELALRLLGRLAASADSANRDAIVAQLRKRLSSFHYSDCRDAFRRLVEDARSKPAIMEVLAAIGDVAVKNYGNRPITIREIVQAMNVALPAPQAPSDPANNAECKTFAERFGTAVVAKDFASAHEMLSSPLKKQYTPKKLEAIIAKESKHSGPPDAYEYGDNDTTAAELRDGRNGFPPLPAHVTDKNFRRWCCLQFLPEEDSDADACFDWWMAVVEEDGEPKVGFFHILDAD